MKTPTFPKIYNVYFLAMIATVGGMLYVFTQGIIIPTPS